MKEMKDILKVILENYEKGGNPLTMDWPFIVGEELALHSRFMGIEKKAILVEVDHSGWKQLLLLKQDEIIQTIGKNYPDYQIHRIIISVKKEKEVIKTQPAKEGRKGQTVDLEDVLDKINNQDFREYLEKLKKRFDQV